jgi:hypothetical protein
MSTEMERQNRREGDSDLEERDRDFDLEEIELLVRQAGGWPRVLPLVLVDVHLLEDGKQCVLGEDMHQTKHAKGCSRKKYPLVYCQRFQLGEYTQPICVCLHARFPENVPELVQEYLLANLRGVVRTRGRLQDGTLGKHQRDRHGGQACYFDGSGEPEWPDCNADPKTALLICSPQLFYYNCIHED